MDKFEKAIVRVLRHEGGYVNDPDDPGGETKYGISRRSYPALDIKGLTKAKAIELYRRDWWEKYGYDRIDHPTVAAKVFDLAVNIGPVPAHRLLQKAVCRTSEPIKVDGIIGPFTVAAVNRHPSVFYLLAMLKLLAIRYYLDLDKPKYLAGWVGRALS